MDLQSLVAAHLPRTARPAPMDPAAEDRYYRNQVRRPRPGPSWLGPMAAAGGLLLLLIGIA